MSTHDDPGRETPKLIPIRELEKLFPPPLGFRVGHGAHVYVDDAGVHRSVPMAYVDAPDGTHYMFIPELPGK